MDKTINHAYVFTDCRHEQATFTKPCEKCGSRKIEHSAFRRQNLGDHWRELQDAEESLEH
jgi:hypothetical protein